MLSYCRSTFILEDLVNATDRIIVGLDVDTLYRAEFFVRLLKDDVGGFKIGYELALAMLKNIITPPLDETAITNALTIRRIFKHLKSGPEPKKIFWDIKFNDIPNTVGAASAQTADLGAIIFSVHASAGIEAIKSAVARKKNSRVFGVTVLTSINKNCRSIFGANPEKKVLQFAQMLLDAGADGIICSPLEVLAVRSRKEFGKMEIATPGVRPEWYGSGDQARIMTPADAVRAGTNFLIIGRPILNPPSQIGNPSDAVKKIAEEIESALCAK